VTRGTIAIIESSYIYIYIYIYEEGYLNAYYLLYVVLRYAFGFGAFPFPKRNWADDGELQRQLG
jgi:hypothetical protein